MDYSQAAAEFMRKAFLLFRTKTQQKLGHFTQGECFVLNHLLFSRQPVSPHALAESLGVSSARIAALLNALEGKGLIVRESFAGDKRRVLVSITELGKEKAQSRLDNLRYELRNILAQLGEADTREYLRITGRILEIATRN